MGSPARIGELGFVEWEDLEGPLRRQRRELP